MPLVEDFIGPVVAAYVDLYNKQKTLKRLQDGKKDEFFGLRDFYRYVGDLTLGDRHNLSLIEKTFVPRV